LSASVSDKPADNSAPFTVFEAARLLDAACAEVGLESAGRQERLAGPQRLLLPA
jgi:hypothetical protein